MTENEAKDILRIIGWNRAEEGDIEGCLALDMAIQALEEIQQYRAIGTLELFELLKEKAIPKEPICKSKGRKYENCDVVVCPNCKGRLKIKSKGAFCDKCGQALVWN